jgi:hypothetical protein
MTEALLNEPQIPTDGKTAAQPAATPEKGVAPAQPSVDASKGAPPTEKAAAPAAPAAPAEPAKKEPVAPLQSLLAEPAKKTDAKAAPSDKKADDSKPPAEGEKKVAPTGPPEKYEWKNEGDLKIATPVMTAYEKAAREAGLSQDSAQKMLDSLRTTVHENAVQRHEAQVREWADSLSAHPTLGGDKLEETGANMRRVMAEFGSPALQGLLMESGLGWHPAVAELLNSIAKKVGGDRIVTGAPPTGSAEDQAKKFYNAMPKV